MSVSGVSSAMSGIVAAQGMFGFTAQAATGVRPSDAGSGGDSTTEAVQVAVLQKALEIERSLVNIFA
jgi:hypothetical protein